MPINPRGSPLRGLFIKFQSLGRRRFVFHGPRRRAVGATKQRAMIAVLRPRPLLVKILPGIGSW
jgi:hypothetical protein